MSQLYLRLAHLPTVSYRFGDVGNIFKILFKIESSLFSRQQHSQDLGFFVWSSTKGFGLLARRAHSTAAYVYRQVRGMTGAPVGWKMQFGEIAE